ncbi:MAG: 2-C-methyl-D-erythritol 2,4-cyclodiphosphate synthase [Ureaplasma sp.]|nr:2-C-methyl-D-erythritol 2,4-cyclodiphosphate synthase [Ureaplasma sp.]
MYLIGFSIDNHQLTESSEFQKIGGVELKLGYKIIAHSDGDIVYHAVAEALLGAIGFNDLGEIFPDTDPSNKNIDSFKIINYVLNLIDKKYLINNIDITIVCDCIYFSNYRLQILNNLKKVIPNTQITLKFTRFEKNDKSAITCYANTIIEKLNINF